MTLSTQSRLASLELAVANLEENLETLRMVVRDHEYGHAPKAS